MGCDPLLGSDQKQKKLKTDFSKIGPARGIMATTHLFNVSRKTLLLCLLLFLLVTFW